MVNQEGSSEQGTPTLFKEKFGMQVLRELTPEELGRKPAEAIATLEGFSVHGQNKTSLIRSLKAISGLSIPTMEDSMRPAGEIFGDKASKNGISGSGFLGKDESLVQVLAEDNDTVLQMGLTHQSLADFLLYFEQVDKYINEHTKKKPKAYQFNGRTFIHTSKRYKGSQESPFYDGTETNEDHTIICMDDGSAISYSGLLPIMINRYGFYEGKKVGYRLDPKRIAEVAGFLPRPENDPVAGLIKDRSAVVEFNSPDQLIRMSNLSQAGIELMSSPNYKVIPQDVGTLLALVELFGKRGFEGKGMPTEQAKAYCQAIAGKIDTTRLTPQHVMLREDSINTLSYVVEDFPQLKQPILSNIETIDFSTEDGSYKLDGFLEQAIEAIVKKTKDGADNPNKEYFQGLLSKVKRTPTNTLQIYRVAAKIYSSGRKSYGMDEAKLQIVNDENLTSLAEMLDTTLPVFRQDIIASFQQLGIPVSGKMSTGDLIKSKKSLEDYEEVLVEAMEFAQKTGGLKDVRVKDMSSLIGAVLKITQDSGYMYSAEELEVMERLRLDPNLIPYAIKTEYSDRVSIGMAIKQLYNGSARERRDLEQTLAQLPTNMDENAKIAVQEIIREFRQSDKTEVGKFAGQLAKRGEEAAVQADQLTEKDVFSEYLKIKVAPFVALLTSSFVNMRLNPKNFRGPIAASFNKEAFEAVVEENADRLSSSQRIRKIMVEGKEYIVDKYGIKFGKYRLRAEDGKIQLLLLTDERL